MNINPNIPFCDEEFVEKIIRLYSKNNLVQEGISYATVKDYCDSWDNLNPISKHGDLKNVQRPWALKAILATIPIGGKILEIGAGEPIIAAILNKIGYKVTVVDPYNGSGLGPTDYIKFTKEFPELRIIRESFSHDIETLKNEENSFDAIYSISVIEHLSHQNIMDIFKGMKKHLTTKGFSIHCIDHVHRGNGENDFTEMIKNISKLSGISNETAIKKLKCINNDINTYYLSAESHNAWRMGKPYEEFPMREMVSIQIITKSEDIQIAL
ncbi:MAG: class I SAM-dependent methyltransferase [Prolixibacteraceae bacterium]|nr:class I SAM-dependent methyltransferase [Prolixibacteraceae bacterium]